MTRSLGMAIRLLLVVGCLAPRLVAQSALEIGGLVTDETGGVVVGATVTLIDERGRTTSTATNTEGRYRLAADTHGKATLTIEAAGFASERKAITLTASTTVDVKLRVAINERVDVLGGLVRLSLDSDQNLSGIRLSGKALEALPDDPESLLHALRLLASSTGTRLDTVAFYVDGLPLTQRLPPKDVIQSIRINANPFSAEFSEPGPGRVEILTKPASEHYHGNARVDFNHSRLDGRSVFEPTRPSYQSRTYEGYVGGPILRDRWGFLAYGGRWDQDDNVVVNATTIDPVQQQPQPLRLNVAAPTRTTAFSLRNDIRVTPNHTFAFEYAQNDQSQRNAGLDSGFDLPERAYLGELNERTASLWVTSVFPGGALNELRARGTGNTLSNRALATGPAVLVLEAFNAGGNQDRLFRENTTARVRVADVLTLSRPAHTIRIGGQAEVFRLDQIDRANFNGTFVFGSDVVRDASGNPVLSADGTTTAISGLERYRRMLAGVPGYRPSQFSVVRGDPGIDFSVFEGAWFAQDDWRAAPRLTVSYGIRHEIQAQGGTRRMKWAPRAGLAWAPTADGNAAVRAGVGLFHTQIPQALFSDALRLDGRRSQRFVVDQPEFFPDVPGVLPDTNLTTTIRTESPELTLPTTFVSTISYERQLTGSLFGSIGYTWRRGMNLLRTRDISGLAAPGQAANPLTLQFESTGRSSAHDVNATVNGAIGPEVTVFGSYGWTSAFQDTDDLYSVPADSANLAAEWGLAPVPRHRASVGATINLPDDFAVYPFVTWASSLPFNITTGYDTNLDSVFTDRPSLVGEGFPGAVRTPYGFFNLTPAPGEAIIPRNFGAGPRLFTFDVTAAKMFAAYNGLTPSARRATLTLSVTNLFNRTNYAPFNGVLTSPFFGTANRVVNKRRVTFSLRYDF